MENYQNLSWDDIKAMYAETHKIVQELVQQSKEFEKKREKEIERIDRMYEKNAREFEKTEQLISNLGAESKETDKRLAKLREESEKIDQELKQEMKKLSKLVGGIGHSNGEMAEEYFYNAFKADISFANEKFDIIEKNKKISNRELEAEYDLLLFNGKSAAIIEVKYNAKPENIRVDRIISRVEIFKKLMPACKDFNVYLGVAAMSFKEGLEAELHQAGIATIRPVGKKMVKFDKDVKVF